MRPILIALLAALLTGCAMSSLEAPESVRIESITPRYMEAQQFIRVSEYWSGTEQTGSRLILRSDPQVRDGFYFVLRLDEKVKKLPRGTRILAEVFTPASPEAQTFTFTLPAKRPRTKEIFVGLTGTDWNFPEAVPGAWRFTLENANGDLLAREQSYLWEL